MTAFSDYDYTNTEYEAIEDWYNGIKFRSKLESKTAQSLDNIGIPYAYEPNGYKLSNGLWYKPDFYLTKAHQYIECKGVMDEKGIAKIMGLVEDTERAVVVVGYDKVMMFMYFFNDITSGIVNYSGDIYIGKCTQCGEKFFYCGEDTYECPCCGAYDGDHYLGTVCEANSGRELFDYGQQLAASSPIYKRIADEFNNK